MGGPEAAEAEAMNQTDLIAADGNGVATCRVSYRMTDQMGVVYYGNYMELFEIGRVELLRASGLRYRDLETDGFLLVVSHVRCDYLGPAHYDDILEVTTRILVLSRAKIHFGYEVRRRGEPAVLARGETHHVFLSPEGKLRRMSPERFAQLRTAANLGGKE